MLSLSLDATLRDESIEGFYHNRDNDNSVVARELREGRESCLVLVQLVDN